MPRYLYLQVRHAGDPRHLEFPQVVVSARTEAEARRKGAKKLTAFLNRGYGPHVTLIAKHVTAEHVIPLDADDENRAEMKERMRA